MIDHLYASLKKAGQKVFERAEAKASKQGVTAKSVLIENMLCNVADVIAGQAKKWHADLIVIGTHGRRGIFRLVMGSDAKGVVRTTPVPVLLVRSTASKNS